MATYLFSALNNNQTLTFNPALDTLAIDIAWMNAASGTFLQSGTDLRLTYNGKTVQLTGVTLARLSSGHVTFANGSKLLIGDNTPGTANDGLSNILTGTARGDYLNGLGGADTMAGDDGNDVYVVDNAGDVVTEQSGQGTDLILSAVSRSLAGVYVENLTLTGTAALNGTGNSLDNTLTGNAAANLLWGHAGNDRLDGGAGADTLYGGTGHDTFVVDNLGDVVVETAGQGTDLILSAVSRSLAGVYVENLTLTGTAALNGTGNSLNNLLTGNGAANTLDGGLGNDWLDGGTGADTLTGGDGNDTYVVDNVGDKVVETHASATQLDTVQSSLANYTLTAHVENLQLLGIGNRNGTGNSLANVLTGNAGTNVLDGAGGADTMTGDDGNDTYVVNSAGDAVTEANASATQIDTVQSWISYTLGANVENLQLLGAAQQGTGNELDNVLTGTAGNNWLNGKTGTDTISYQSGATAGVTASLALTTVQATGGSGSDTLLNIENLTGSAYADTLTGNAGNNLLSGGNGNDTLKGGGGADTLNGEAGDDLLIVTDLGFQGLYGGTGTDTVRLAGTGLALDLTALGSKFKFHDVEAIDLNGANSLTLDASAPFLRVDGNAGSAVHTGFGWTSVGDATADGKTYHTYTQGAATLWVNTAIGTVTMIDPAVSLVALDGATGFRLDGTAAFDVSGLSVSGAGDVNGDGYADLIVGAPSADPHGSYSGSSYVVFGKATGFGATLDLTTLDGTDGFRLDGAAVQDFSGQSVSGAGDVNGDGFADLLVGAKGADPNGVTDAGASYVVFGKATGFGATLDLSGLDGATGFRLHGAAAGDGSGRSVSAAGDVNGDGYEDLIVGAPYADLNGSYSGSSYVVFGKATGFGTTLALSGLTGTNGFRLGGAAAGNWSGFSVSGAGDVNGDGYEDLIVGAYRADPNGTDSGASYVVFGKASGFGATLALSALNGTNGFRLDGAVAWDYSGCSVSAAGDVNGDGFADLIVGAPYADPNGNWVAGASYVVFGQASGFAATLNLSALNGTNGFRLDGAVARDYSGISVSGAGDVNGDGYDDLIVGALEADPNGYSSGASYVVFGKASGFGAALDLSGLDGTTGFRLDGAAVGDRSGVSVSGAGDVNGDGFADLLVGADGADPNGSYSGSSYMVFGGNFTGAVTQLGSVGDDSLIGTATAERFVAGQGSDTLTSGGGADVLYGGAGDDLLQVADLSFQRADGGSGTDTLALVGGGLNLNLADFRNQVFGIERIDLTGSGDNTLTLLQRDLLNLSDTGNTLRVEGNAGDHYHFSDSGWVQGADVTLVGVAYHTYDNGAAHLLLNAALTAV
jgi:Ca2+-binding RTX toxin-like protein